MNVPVFHKQILWSLMFGPPFYHPTLIMNMKILRQAGVDTYPSNYPHAEDYGLYIKLLGKVEFANLDESLLKYRISATSVSAKHKLMQHKVALHLRREAFEMLSGESLPDSTWAELNEYGTTSVNALQVFGWFKKINEQNSLLEEVEFQRRILIYIKQLILKRGLSISSFPWFLRQLVRDPTMIKYLFHFSFK